MPRLAGRRAIVTGGGSGIGAAIALAFAREGATVGVADIDYDAAQRVVAAIIAEDLAAMAVPVNVAEADSVAAMAEAVNNRFGITDVLVNCAGINVFCEPLRTSTFDWTRCMAVNLDGAWHCCRAVLPAMLAAGKGAIINIASTHSLQVMRDTFPYPVAKHALIGLTRSLALQYAAQGITVNAILPGFIDTPINDRFFATFDDPAAARRNAEANQPVGRLGLASEVAAVATLLASDEARFIVGTSIIVDGGVSIQMYE